MTNSTDLPQVKIADFIWMTCVPVLVIIGITGNLMAIIVLSRKNHRRTSTAVFLIALAVTDIIVLSVSGIVDWIITVFGVYMWSNFTCKLYVFALYTSTQCSSWILVAVTGERLCSVLLPLRVNVLCTRRKAALFLAAIIVCLFLFNVHSFFTHRAELDNTTYCESAGKYEYFVVHIWTWLDFATAFAIPFLLLLIGNTIVMIVVKRNHSIRTSMVSNGEPVVRHRTRQRMNFLTATMLSLNFVFFICMSPLYIYIIGQPYWLPESEMTPERQEDDRLVLTIVSALQLLNNAVNFFLYFLLGPNFRKEAIRMFCCCCPGTRLPPSRSSTSNRDHRRYAFETV